MTIEDYNRKLTAILSTDVKGYGRLMDEDEEARIRSMDFAPVYTVCISRNSIKREGS